MTRERLELASNKAVIGEQGWSVNVPDIHRVVYRELNKSITIEIEGGESSPGNIDWLIYVPTVPRWDQPFTSEIISDETWTLIGDRISRSLQLLEMKHAFIKP